MKQAEPIGALRAAGIGVVTWIVVAIGYSWVQGIQIEMAKELAKAADARASNRPRWVKMNAQFTLAPGGTVVGNPTNRTYRWRSDDAVFDVRLMFEEVGWVSQTSTDPVPEGQPRTVEMKNPTSREITIHTWWYEWK